MPRIFRYNALFSLVGLFVSAFYFSFITPSYDFIKYTISGLVFVLSPFDQILFNATFLIASLLYLGFSYYVFHSLHIPFRSFMSLLWLAPVVALGLLGFFPYNVAPDLHQFLARIMFFGWGLCELMYARLINTSRFNFFTYVILAAKLMLLVVFKFFSIPTNSVLEYVYLVLSVVWVFGFTQKLQQREKLWNKFIWFVQICVVPHAPRV